MKHEYKPFNFKRPPYGPFAVEYQPQEQTGTTGKRACVYVRDQYVTFEPIISRTDKLATFAQEKGYTVVERISDIAPGTGARRNGLKVLLQDAKRKNFDAVFICCLNTLTPNEAKVIPLLVELDDLGIGVCTEQEGWINKQTQPCGATLLDNLVLFLT